MNDEKAPDDVAEKLNELFGPVPTHGADKSVAMASVPDDLKGKNFVRCVNYQDGRWCQLPDGTWVRCG